jgi:hypothetical protein
MRVRVARMLCARKVHDFEQAPEVKTREGCRRYGCSY